MYNKSKFPEVMAVATEYERKFRATPALLSAIDRAFPGDNRIFSMETTYYDTPSGGLSARRYTLRRRLENGVSVCTLKAPAGTARGEWEIQWEAIQEAIPLLIAQGAPATLRELVQEGLVPVCGAKFTRIAKTVCLEDGQVELALDKGFLFGGGRELPLCEVEAELKAGTQALCDRFAEALAAQFSLTEERESKFSRALRLYKGETDAG